MSGRPSVYDRATADRVLEAVASGESLRSVCREDWAPPVSTFRSWVTEDVDGIFARYAHARDQCVLSWAEETIEIADDGRNDFMERVKPDGSIDITLDREHIQRSVARINARQWMAARLLPKTFGDKTTVDLNAKIDVSQMSDADLMAIAAGKASK
jgi:hypothetical protein